MTEYIYTVVDKNGKRKKDTISAASMDRARKMLRDQGLTVVKIEESNIFNKDLNISIGGSVKPRDLSVFCRQFQSILNAGVTIVDALDMLSGQTENKVFAKTIGEVQLSVKKGSSLSEAMKEHPKVFPDLLVNMIEAGEASGNLELSMERMATQFEKSAKLKALIKKAMIYPIVILVVAIAVMIVMSVAVIPQFAKMFKGMGAELPGVTKVVLAISDVLIHKWWLLIIIIVAAVFAISYFAKTETGRYFFSRIAIKLPLFGKLSIKSNSASFARTLSTLVCAGIAISDALEIASRSIKNVLFRDVILDARKEVEQGVALSVPLRKAKLFPMMIPQMISIGEETGNIDGMLTKSAEYYEDEVEIATESLTSAMEPLIIIVMGVIVGTLVLAMYMPMISMYDNLENL